MADRTDARLPTSSPQPFMTTQRRSISQEQPSANRRAAEQRPKHLSRSSSHAHSLLNESAGASDKDDDDALEVIKKISLINSNAFGKTFSANSIPMADDERGSLLQTVFQDSREPQFQRYHRDLKAIAYATEVHAGVGHTKASGSGSRDGIESSNEVLVKEILQSLNSEALSSSLAGTLRVNSSLSNADSTGESSSVPKLVAEKVIDVVVRKSEMFSAEAIDRHKPPFGLSTQDIVALCDALVAQYARKACAVVSVRSPVKIFGDLHGNIQDLADFFTRFGKPLQYSGDLVLMNYIFNGDFVDRGLHSLEVVLTLFSLRFVYKDKITLIRGNHECETINAVYGFLEECRIRYPDGGLHVYHAINKVFTYLPLVAFVETFQAIDKNLYAFQRTMAVMHGGIGPDCMSLSDVEKIPMPLIQEESCPAAMQLLWDDPDPNIKSGFEPNPTRGGSCYLFSGQQVRQFCAINKINVIVRSHQCVMSGYELFAGGHMATVFSARNYTGVKGNHAAMMLVAPDNLRGMPKISTCILEYTPPEPGNIQAVTKAPTRFSPELESRIESPSVTDQIYSKLNPVPQQQYLWVNSNWTSYMDATGLSHEDLSDIREAFHVYSKSIGFTLESMESYIRDIFPHNMKPGLARRLMHTFDITNFQKLTVEAWWIFLYTTTIHETYQYTTVKGMFRALFLFRYYDLDQDGNLNQTELQDFINDFHMAAELSPTVFQFGRKLSLEQYNTSLNLHLFATKLLPSLPNIVNLLMTYDHNFRALK